MTEHQLIESMTGFAQIHNTIVNGASILSTFNKMEPEWTRLHEEGTGRNIIVEDHATRIKYQVVMLYVARLMKYVRAFDYVPMMQMAKEDPANCKWKIDSILLNLACNKVKDHRDLFTMAMTSIFGIPTEMIECGLEPTYEKVYAYTNKILNRTYEVPEFLQGKEVKVEDFIAATKELPYNAFVEKQKPMIVVEVAETESAEA